MEKNYYSQQKSNYWINRRLLSVTIIMITNFLFVNSSFAQTNCDDYWNEHNVTFLMANYYETCSDVISISAQEDPAKHGWTGYWSIQQGANIEIGNRTYFNTTISGLNRNHDNIIAWTVVTPENCTHTENVTIRNVGVENNPGGPYYNCGEKNKEYTLAANDPYPNNWEGWWEVADVSKTQAALAGFSFVNSTAANSGYVNAPSGTMVVTWTVRDPNSDKNCKTIKEVTITNNDFEISAGNSDDVDVCADVVSLDASHYQGDFKGEWHSLDGNSPILFSNSTNYQTTVTNLEFGSNILRWVVEYKGCTKHADIDVRHKRYLDFTAGNDITTCDDIIILNGTNPNSFLNDKPVTAYWECDVNGAAFSSITSSSPKVSNLQLGPNTFTWHVNNGYCDMVDQVTITSNFVRAYSGSGDDYIKQCEDFYSLMAQLPDTKFDSVAWSVGQGNAKFGIEKYISNDVVFDPANSNMSAVDKAYWSNKTQADFDQYASSFKSVNNKTMATSLAQGKNELIWHVYYNGCETMDTVRINNIAPDKAIVPNEREQFCSTEYHLSANEPNIGKGHWEQIGGASTIKIVNPNSNYTDVTGLSSGPNNFKWVITNVQDGLKCTSEALYTLVNSEITTSAGQNVVTCEDYYTLCASDPAPYSGYWIEVDNLGAQFENNNSTSFEVKVTNLHTGNNTFRWVVTDSNTGCHAEAEVVITNNKPTQPKLGADYTVCQDFATLNGNAYASDEIGNWEAVGGFPTINNKTATQTLVTGLNHGLNEFTWTITRGQGANACTSEPASIKIYASQFQIEASTPKPEYCEDKAEVFGTTNAEDYTSLWTARTGTGTFTSDASQTNAVVTNLSPGINIITWTVKTKAHDGTDCELSADVEVLNNTAPKAILPKEDVSCSSSYDIQGNQPMEAGVTGYWKVEQGSGSFSAKSNFKTTITGLELGQHNYISWSLQKGKCVNTAVIDIFADEAVTSVTSDNGTGIKHTCDNELTISGTEPPSGGKGWWTTTSQDVIFVNNDTESPNPRITNITTGSHVFVWNVETEHGCGAQAELKVVNEKSDITAHMSGTNPVCNGQVELNGTSPTDGAVGWWEGPSNADFSDKSNNVTTMFMSTTGDNVAYWHVKKGNCESVSSVYVFNATVTAYGGEDIIVCSDEETQSLIAQAPPQGGRGWWEYDNESVFIADKSSHNTTISKIQQGTNTIRWNVASADYIDPVTHKTSPGCTAKYDVSVSNNDFSANAGTDFEVCGPQAQLNAVLPKGAVGSWSGGVFLDNTDPKTTIYNLRNAIPTELTWTVTYNNCSKDAIVTVTNTKVDITIPTGGITGTRTIYSDELQIEATNTAGNGTWHIVQGRGKFDNSTNNVTTVTNLGVNDNILRWEVINGNNNCHTTHDVVITRFGPQHLSITSFPKVDYIKGETLDLTGGILEITYNNETTEQISLDKATIIGFDNNKIGEQILTINYLDLTTELKVQVSEKSIIAIAIADYPKITYEEGESFATDNGTIKVIYSNSSIDTVSLANTIVEGYNPTKIGEQTLTINYCGHKTDLKVTVNAKPTTNPYTEPKIVINFYQIYTLDELLWFMYYVNTGHVMANAILLNDLVIVKDCLQRFGNLRFTLHKSGSDIITWTPIGNDDNVYQGTFDGQGHTISGLYINDANQSNVGLFGNVGSEAVIKNIGVTDSYIAGNENVGAICGKAEGTIVNCYSVSEVKGNINVNELVGDKTTKAVIENCYYLAEEPNTNDPCAKNAEEFKSGEVATLLSQGATINGVTYSGESFAGITELPGTDIIEVIEQPENPDNPSTAVAEISNSNIRIWSFGSTVYIENATSDIYIVNLSGSLITKCTPESSHIEINLNNKGVYIVKTGNSTQKIVIQ